MFDSEYSDLLYYWFLIGLFCLVWHYDFAKLEKCPKLDLVCVAVIVLALFALEKVAMVCGALVTLYFAIAIFGRGMHSNSKWWMQ